LMVCSFLKQPLMNATTTAGLLDRALVAVIAFTFVRVSVVVDLKVEDDYPQKKRWWLRLREKNGKVNQMPCHHKLETYLDAYLAIREDRKVWLFRVAIRWTGKLSDRLMSRTDVWSMVEQTAKQIGMNALGFTICDELAPSSAEKQEGHRVDQVFAGPFVDPNAQPRRRSAAHFVPGQSQLTRDARFRPRRKLGIDCRDDLCLN